MPPFFISLENSPFHLINLGIHTSIRVSFFHIVIYEELVIIRESMQHRTRRHKWTSRKDVHIMTKIFNCTSRITKSRPKKSTT